MLKTVNVNSIVAAWQWLTAPFPVVVDPSDVTRHGVAAAQDAGKLEAVIAARDFMNIPIPVPQ